MKRFVIAAAAASTLAVAGCTTQEGALFGAATGAAVGAATTSSVGGAIVGAGIGALAGAILVETHNNGWCTYRYQGQLYRDRCV